MGLGVVRKGDYCSGHGCWPSRQNFQGSSDTFVNGIAVHRQNDRWVVHCCKNDCHDGFLVNGSPTVFVNGLQIARKNDPISCGSKASGCSSDVFAGG